MTSRFTIPKSVGQAAARGPVSLHTLGRAEPEAPDEKTVVAYQPRNAVHELHIRLRRAFTGWGGESQP